jgi:hypothetical protein
VNVSRTAGVGEEAGVVRLVSALSVDAELVGKAHRDQRRVQAVLEREGHAEVRTQAEGRDQLGCTDSVAALRLARHSRTIPRGSPPRPIGDLGRTPDWPHRRMLLLSLRRGEQKGDHHGEHCNRTNRGEHSHRALPETERRLWQHYGLKPEERFLDLDAPARLRVLEVGSGESCSSCTARSGRARGCR